MKSISLTFGFFMCALIAYAQPEPTSPGTITQALEKKEQMENESLIRDLPARNAGPTIMSGRVVDLAVNPDNPIEFYVAYASGGLWYTNNNGISFEPVMDKAPTLIIGDIDVNWETGDIWVGTGENNASRSSYSGAGIFRSSDHGESWEYKGLPDSHHIGRILINPENPSEVIAGVTGHLYSVNEHRGIYKTTDGGETWEKTLHINDSTGIIDLVMEPGNFETLYATAWEKDRKAWNFKGSGAASGIYKSTDGGDTWTRISDENSGFPTGDGVGRIGLAVFDQNTIYAVHDSQFHREKEEDKESFAEDGLKKEDFKDMTEERFLELDNKKLNDFLKTNGFQEKYRAENVKQLVRSGSVKPADLAKYLEDANAMLFDTPVIGAEVYKSTDGGETWQKTHEGYIDDLFYSYGYYFAQIAVDPRNADKLYVGGVPIIRSDDGGKTWKSINGENVHSDHHAIWINPNRTGHIINGNDGGVNISYDDGETWSKHNSNSVGQFYAVNIDHQKPYNIYGGLQDNGVWKGPHNARESDAWHGEGEYPWKRIMGGDGMQVQIDSRNPDIVYTGFQFGNYYRLDLANGKQTYIQPKHELGESPYRFNWQTPILLSPHNQDILYLGGNKLMRSMNQGDDWTAISPDLTKGGRPGNVAYGTITSISESPFDFGHIYVGTDDGLLHVTRNSGGDWKDISESFPEDLWVSRVIASEHDKERVYATLNGYRWDDFTPYVYRSDDGGNTWKNIGSNLPQSPVNVIKEDPHNEELLYLGTDNGLYVSLNGGDSWVPHVKDLPYVAVHDLVVQPEALDLIVGTHGRSVYVIDIAPLSGFNEEVREKELHLYAPEKIRHSSRWGASWSSWMEPYEPEIHFDIYSRSEGAATITIVHESGVEAASLKENLTKGFNKISYDLTIDEKASKALNKKSVETTTSSNKKIYLPKGSYTVTVSRNGKQDQQTLVLE
ncbi:WD40/YVTN/BNR-like repeat-containing protein [Robertkochia aurantiaca]|uniref:WD40/YVTN/BNR-like repeat-containing protein n=1 Tax=Robertkochia aurantiaca TaxID=2873700 RepID=UPI001CCDD05A|nr:sialidase family protein [Robertkochia sp. 3YJGBD-33]